MEKSEWIEEQTKETNTLWKNRTIKIFEQSTSLIIFLNDISSTGFVSLPGTLTKRIKLVITDKDEFKLNMSQSFRIFQNQPIKKNANAKKEFGKMKSKYWIQ